MPQCLGPVSAAALRGCLPSTLFPGPGVSFGWNKKNGRRKSPPAATPSTNEIFDALRYFPGMKPSIHEKFTGTQ